MSKKRSLRDIERDSLFVLLDTVKRCLETTDPCTFPHIEMALLSSTRDYGVRSLAQLVELLVLRIDQSGIWWDEPIEKFRADCVFHDLRHLINDHDTSWIEFNKQLSALSNLGNGRVTL